MKLLHNTSNPITAGIWREEGRIRKVITASGTPRHVDWSTSRDLGDWRYWRREAHVYEEGLQQVYAAEGLRGPELLGLRDDGDTVEMGIEAVSGPSGALAVASLAEVAEALGAAQGRLLRKPLDRPWLARSFLRDFVASKHVNYRTLVDEACWGHPLVASTWPRSLREGLPWLAAQREALLQRAEGLPRTLCHLDFWGHNLVMADGGPVVLDWACLGDGALGEDLSNLVVEAVLDELLPPEGMADVAEELLQAYTRGVGDAGVDPSLARRGFQAAAVKWVWLGPLHLARALSGEHHVYGGGAEVDPSAQYRARGLALEQVVRWARGAWR